MAGQPKKRKMLADMKERGGVPWFMSEIASGRTLASIARELEVSRDMLDVWIRRNPKIKAEYQEAKRRAAGALVEQGLEIVDNAPSETMATVAKAKMQAGYRAQLAARWNPEEYGEKQGGVTINVANLHLDALRAQPIHDTIAYTEPEQLESGD